MWHKHSWQKMDVTFNEPWNPRPKNWMGLSQTQVDRMFYGFTNVTWQCKRCPAVKIESHLGKVDF